MNYITFDTIECMALAVVVLILLIAAYSIGFKEGEHNYAEESNSAKLRKNQKA